MKIHITGASGSGTTTLGTALAAKLGVPYYDTDNYYWAPAEIPFTNRRDIEIRNKMLENDLKQTDSWVVGGSVTNWNNDLYFSFFDLVVFLYVPSNIRMKRLQKRERDRYGDLLFTAPIRSEMHKEFMAWAARYEQPTTLARSFKIHREWLQKVTCPVLEISGDNTTEERITLILSELRLNGF